MKSTILKPVVAVGLAGLLAGCVSPSGRPNYTESGALIGGLSGATIGTMADRRAPGVGALIGGATGLIAGSLIGHSMDEQSEPRWRSVPPPAYYPPPPAAPAAPPTALPTAPLSVSDIKSMAKAGVSDNFIIGEINDTHAVYNLDANALIDLSNAGVSQKVIAYMVGTANLVVAQAPPAPQAETALASPGPDYVWVDGEWVWNGGTWIWIGGRWIYPPYPHAVWVGARWERGPNGWHRMGGHWR